MVCIRRSPEYTIPYGYSVYNVCIQIFGAILYCQEKKFTISIYSLCRSKKSLTVRLKSSTAAARILSIDSGGPREIISLENLAILQQILDEGFPLSDLIELTVGYSSGGLISLSNFILRIEIESCKSLFQKLARKVLAPIRRKYLLGFWLSDGLYNIKIFEQVLKDHYTETRRIFDTLQNCLLSNKIAVIANKIKDSALFIFANYNGSVSHRAEPDTLDFKFLLYKLLTI